MSEGPKFKIVDMSQQWFGKYQHCTMRWDGLWWADSDIVFGKRWGAKPAPENMQDNGRRWLARLLRSTPLRFVWP